MNGLFLISSQLAKMIENELVEYNIEKHIIINREHQEKLNYVYESLWKRKEYSKIQSTISVSSVPQ